jgi:RNA polymerase sigma-70 factor (ECF subfamily)
MDMALTTIDDMARVRDGSEPHGDKKNYAVAQAARLPVSHKIAPDYIVWSDEALVAAVCQGSRPALEKLYDRYVNGCYGLALKVVRDPFTAEEIVQEVFLKLWTHPQSYVPGRGKFSGWLLTLVHNRSVDKVRRAQSGTRGRSVPIDLDSGNGTTLGDTLADPALTPHEETWRTEQGRIVQWALSLLPDSQRQAIGLAYFGGLTQKEIAERLGEPLGTIKTRTRTGLLRMRKLLMNPALLGDAE